MTKTTKPTAAPSDPAALHQEILKRQRQRIHRTLLKRRRRKSGQ